MSKIEYLIQSLHLKTQSSFKLCFKKAIWAGTFIAIGAILYSLVTSFNAHSTILRFLGALLFTIGLNLVVFKRAQLFTGNNLLFVNLLQKKTSFKLMMKNWSVVYLGNLLGSLIIVAAMYFFFINVFSLKEHLLNIASKKVNYSFHIALYKAFLCNSLVCIAIYFAITMETLTKKVIGIIIPITTFVYFGFEHSIANMFFIPLGLSFSNFTWDQSILLFLKNIIPVTIGNILGGLFISSLILFIYNIKRGRLTSPPFNDE